MAEAKSSKKRTYEEVLASTKAIVAEKHRKRVEAAAQPGETFAEVENRLKADDAAKERETAQEKARQQAEALAAGRQREEGVKDEAKAKAPASSMRKPPEGDAQPDFFVPALYDVGGRDSRHIMDVAVFRLGKKDKRAGELIRYELSDGFVEVTAGPYGMASVWDYDIERWPRNFRQTDRWTLCFVATGQRPEKAEVP